MIYRGRTHLLSCAKLLYRVFELKEETDIFLSDCNNNDANLFYNEDFIQKVTYLVDIFEKLSNLNKSV
jgi:hypothetical protein